jgi:hypothetical protein
MLVKSAAIAYEVFTAGRGQTADPLQLSSHIDDAPRLDDATGRETGPRTARFDGQRRPDQSRSSSQR